MPDLSPSQETSQTPEQSGGAAVLGQEALKSQAFRRWFGDSQVIDAAGKPLVVFHGTARDFRRFDPSRIGKNWGRQGSDVFGFFFTTKPEEAEHNASRSAKRGGAPHLMPVYVSLQNPLLVSAQHGQNATNDYDTYKRDYRARMVEGGHDGIIVDDGVEKLIVALQPSQIKSAIGNSGRYDPSNPDITDRITAAKAAQGFVASLTPANRPGLAP